jgi:hypothetical protein
MAIGGDEIDGLADVEMDADDLYHRFRPGPAEEPAF